MLEIFFTTKCLAISSTPPREGYTIDADPTVGISREQLLPLLDRHRRVTLLCQDEAACFEAFASCYTKVEAAGGLVKNTKSEYLMIHRNGRYDLPKGHWEEGETIEECAVREVEEETGVSGIILSGKICETLHAYYMFGRWEVKRTHWYSMSSDFSAPLTPQQEEGIEAVEWCSEPKLKENLKGSFPTIQRVVAEYFA